MSDNSSAIAAPSASANYSASYVYDQLNRPIGASWSPVQPQAPPSASTSVSFGYTYDGTNRRIGQTVADKSWWSYPSAATNIRYTPNNLNQYTTVGSVTPSYDGNGNLTSDGTFTYGYDAENRLISASGTGLSATYDYDAQGRRKNKTVNGTSTIFVTDSDNREVLEYNGTSGAVGNWYAYALGPNDVLNQMNITSTTRATFIPDIQGSFIGALDAASGNLTKFGYQTYGESSSPNATFGYTGQRIDPETNGLYYYRARQYIPVWGRFMQADVIGYDGGTNLYAYVLNDPLNRLDPSGQDTLAIGIGGTAVVPIPFFPAVSVNVLGGFGLVIDTQGNVAFYGYYGGGGGSGVTAGIGVNVQTSNANTINSIAGPFALAGGSLGSGVGASFDIFTGKGANNEPVTGYSFTGGAQAGAAVSAGTTNTILSPSLNIEKLIFGAPALSQNPTTK